MLTIAIPTYNRPDSLSRLLTFFTREIESSSLVDAVEVLVLDNSESDLTESKCRHGFPGYVRYYRNEANIGYDKNIWRLYELAAGDYVWYCGDDDAPVNGCVAKVLELLKAQPTLAILPFRQPAARTEFPYPGVVTDALVHDPATIVDTIFMSGKLTSFVLSKRTFDTGSVERLRTFVGLHWMPIALSLELVHVTAGPSMVVANEFIAGVNDAEVKRVPWLPDAFLSWEHLFEHPASESLPRARRRALERSGYHNGVVLTLFGASGAWDVFSRESYRAFGRRIPIKAHILWRPKLLLFVVVLRLGIAGLFKGPIVGLSRKSGYE